MKKAKKKENKAEKQKDSEKSSKTVSEIRDKLQNGIKTKEVLKHHSNCVYVLTFIGNVMASEVEQLREQICYVNGPFPEFREPEKNGKMCVNVSGKSPEDKSSNDPT